MNDERLAALWDSVKKQNPSLPDDEVTRRVLSQKQPSTSSRGKGFARAAIGQGLAFGFGDEIEAAVQSLRPSRKSYAEELANIRGEMETYRQERPKEAFLAETAGGLLLPGGLATKIGGKALGAGSRLMRGATTAVGAGATQGALAGAGTTEGGIKERVTGAVTGGAIGAGTGGLLGGAVSKIAAAATRGGWTQSPAVRTIAKELERAGMTPQELVQRGRTAPEGSAIADVLGEPAIRTLRDIRASGGRAGAAIEQAMEERVAGSPQRLQRELYGATRGVARRQENIAEEIEESIKRGNLVSKPLYREFERQAPKAIPAIDDILRTPTGQEVLARARRIAANERREFIEPAVPAQASSVLNQFGQPARVTPAQPAKYHPQSLDDIKKAMDALIYDGRLARVQPGQGGIAPSELNATKALRREFLGAVDEAYPEYKLAREAWAGEFAYREARENGVDLANNRALTPEEISLKLREYDGSERFALQQGFIDGIRQRIEKGSLSYRQIGTQEFDKRMRAVLGNEEGASIVNAFRAEGRLMGAAQTIRGRAQAGESAADIGRLGGSNVETFIGPGGARRAAFASAREFTERLAEPMLERRRMGAAETLLSRPAQIGDILKAVQEEELARRRGRTAGFLTGGAIGGAAARGIQQDYNRRNFGVGF